MLVKILLCVIILLSTADTKYNLKQVVQFWQHKQCILPFETLSLNKTEPEDNPFLQPCFENPGNEVCNMFVHFTIQVCKAIGTNTTLINHYRPLIGSAILDQVKNVQPICSLAKVKYPVILKFASYMVNSSYCEAQCKDTMNLCSLLVVAVCNSQAQKYCQQSLFQDVKEPDQTPQVTKELAPSPTTVTITTTTAQSTARESLTSTLLPTTKMATSNDTQNKPTAAPDTSPASSVTTDKEKTTPKVDSDTKTEEPKTVQGTKQDNTNTETIGTEKVQNEKLIEPKTTQEPTQDKTTTPNPQKEGTEKQDPNTVGEPENEPSKEPLDDLGPDHSDDHVVTSKKPKGQADANKGMDSSKLNQGASNVEPTPGIELDGSDEDPSEVNGPQGSNEGNGDKETDEKPKGSKDNAQNTDNKKEDKKTQHQGGLSVDDEDESYSSGHFIAYFLSAVIICVAGYIIFHNKQKIMAFVIEGRGAHQRRHRSKGVKYTELKSNVEEVMPSLEKTATAKNFVY